MTARDASIALVTSLATSVVNDSIFLEYDNMKRFVLYNTIVIYEAIVYSYILVVYKNACAQ